MTPGLVILQTGMPFERSALAAPRHHLLPGTPPLVFLVKGSRLVEVDAAFHSALSNGDRDAEQELYTGSGVASVPADPASGLSAPSALSLNVAQSCNLSCSYCYADEGRFGDRPKLMPLSVALRSIDQLLDQSPRRGVTIGFIGGEPFVNRTVVHAAVEYAVRKARAAGKQAGFSVTTNATLLNDEDIDLLRRHAFAVSVSLDGGAGANDAHRKARNGESSWAMALQHLEPLLRDPAGARLAARATITREDLRVAERVEALCSAGFTDVGVSPLRTSPVPSLALRGGDWPHLLAEMIRAAEDEFSRVERGLSLRFSNLAIALKQIHRGSARRLPCGAGANYASVSATGEYYTCHRTVGDARFSLGATAHDPTMQRQFVSARDVDQQPECRSCWARYLCGGGCHAEVIHAGRTGCDYIRGWIEYCLRFYDRLLRLDSGFFDSGNVIGEHHHESYFSS